MVSIFNLIWMEGQDKPRKKGGGGKHPSMQVTGKGKKQTFSSGGKRRTIGRPRFVSRSPRTKAIVKAQYAKTDHRWRTHIREFITYITERDKSRWEDRRMFDRNQMDIDPKQAIDRLTGSRGEYVAVNKLILSSGDNSINQVDYVRENMEQLEKALGIKLEWYAVPHYNSDHYHNHIAIAGKIPNQDIELSDVPSPDEIARARWAKELEGKDFRLDREDLDLLRETGNEYLLRQRMLDYVLDRYIEREFGLKDWYRQHDVDDLLGKRDWDKQQDELNSLGLANQKYDKDLSKEFGYDRYFDLGAVFTDVYDKAHADYLLSLQKGQTQEHDRGERQPEPEQSEPKDCATGDMIFGLQTTSGGHQEWDASRLGDILYSSQLPEPDFTRDIIEREMVEGSQDPSNTESGDKDKHHHERKHDDRGDSEWSGR